MGSMRNSPFADMPGSAKPPGDPALGLQGGRIASIMGAQGDSGYDSGTTENPSMASGAVGMSSRLQVGREPSTTPLK